MRKHWSGKFDPCCSNCMRSPDEIRGKLTPELLEEYGWVHSGFDWFCNVCEAVGRDESETLDWSEEA